jgi:CHAT domain-containing protein/Tfp pilus assembly protein PilF
MTALRSCRARWPRVRMRAQYSVVALLLGWSPCIARGAEPETTQLTDQAIIRELHPGETHSYVLSADPDEWLKIVVVQRSVDVAVTLVDPAGQALLTYDEQGDQGDVAEEVVLVAEVGGEHRIEVRPANPQSGGRYEIRLIERRPALPRDRRWFAAARASAKAEEGYPCRDGDALRAALALNETVLEEWRALGERRREAGTLNIVGSIHFQLGEREKALDEMRAALAIAHEVGSFEEQSISAGNVAATYGALGEQRRAVEELLPLLDTARQKDRKEAVCVLENNLASLLGQLGELQQALYHSRAALDACRPLSPFYAGSALLKLAGQYLRLGLQQRALEVYAEALATARRSGSAVVASIALARTGTIQLRRGEPRKAAETLKEALSFAESSGNLDATAEALIQMGKALTELGETASAAEHFEKAMQIAERTSDRGEIVVALLWKGDLGVATGQIADARQDYERALGDSRNFLYPHYEAAALHGLARVEVASGRLDEALRRSEEAIGVAESLRLRVLSQQSRAEYLATVRPYYELAVDVLMSLHAAHPAAGYDARAFQMSERGRARSLIEGLASATDRSSDRIDSDLAQKERELRERINGQAARVFRLQAQTTPTDDVAAARKEVESLLDQLQEMQGRASEVAPTDAAALTRGVPLPEVQQRVLDERSLLLVYALGERRSFVWAVSRDSVVSRELPPRATIDAEVRRFHEALSARNSHPRFETPERRHNRLVQADAEAADAGRKLSELLLRPVATELGSRRLFIVADDSLHQVPFAALPAPETARPNGKQASEPLLECHEVQHVPSAAALDYWRLRAPPRLTKTLAVFADPVFDRHDPRVGARVVASAQGLENDWRQELTRSLELSGLAANGHIPRLPHTREEARALISLVPRDRSYVALGFDANRKTALSAELSSYPLVHFATHAVVDEATPDLSSIVLSLIDREGHEQDGFLRAEDASQLHLNAELVTLSGCSTGLGKQVRGEGTLGLAHSFLRAGARRVLVSLWDVDDRATAAFMVRLYRAMLGPRRLSPAAALRETQINMRAIARWSAPYYWAGFVLTGDPSDGPAASPTH